MRTVILETDKKGFEVSFGLEDKDYEKFTRFLRDEEEGIGLFLARTITVRMDNETRSIIIMEAPCQKN